MVVDMTQIQKTHLHMNYISSEMLVSNQQYSFMILVLRQIKNQMMEIIGIMKALDKVYEYRFDFDPVPGGWKLDWDFIKDDIESIYGQDYIIEYPPFQTDGVVVGWLKYHQKIMIELNKEESNFHDGEFFLHRLIYKGNSFLNQENEFWKLPFEEQ